MNVKNENSVGFLMLAPMLSLPVLKHLKRHNPFDGEVVLHTLYRIGTSKLFKIKHFVVTEREVQHLVDSRQIKAG